jgi:hypothetical protein
MSGAVELTLFAKHVAGPDATPLSKVISLNGGDIHSDGSACIMSRGDARRLPVASADALARTIAGLSSLEALALGRLRPDLPAKVAVVAQRNLNGQPGIIARTGEFVCYRDGTPGYALIDFDRKGMPAEVAAQIADAGGTWAALCMVCPGLAQATRVSRPSTSSGLFHAQTGQRYPGSGGEHIYLAVADATDGERFLRALHERAWLTGLGWFDVGAAGQLLDRSLVDRMVAGPERLVFEGAPVVNPPLAQDAAARMPVVTAGKIIDTRAACPQLTPFERERLTELKRADRHRVADRASDARARFVSTQAARLADKHGVPIAAARRMAELWIGGELLPIIGLPWDDASLDGFTVGDVLSDPQRFVGETLADPLEGIEYGRSKAIVMQRADGSLWLHSFAHGRTVYELRFDAAAIEAVIRATPKNAMVETFLRLLPVATLAPDQETQLRDLLCDLAAVKRRPVDVRIKRSKEERARQQAMDERSRRAAERTDPRPRRPAPSVEDERLPVLTDLDAILCAVPDPEPPMRDIENRPTEVKVRRPLGLHALTAAGSNAAEPDDKRLPPPEMPLLTTHDDISLAHLIERHVEYARMTDEAEQVVALPPLFVTHYRMFRASRLPVVGGIVTAPLMLPSGNLLAGVGLARDLSLIFRIDPALLAALPQRDKIEPRHVAAALRWLHDEWLVDVTANYAGRLVLIALALSVLERVLLPERPAFFVTAGRRGGGKTTAVVMVVAAVTGLRPPAAAWSPSEEERRKALFSYLSQALAVLVWDNIPRGTAIACPSIEKSLTMPTYQDRVLGETQIREVPATTIQVFTGNNIAPVGDLASRSLSVWLDVTRPDPENRPVTHADPVGWTFDNRATILRALYTILLGNSRLNGGKQEPPKTRFRSWWHLCGAPLEYATGLLIKERDDWFPGDLKAAHTVAAEHGPLDFVALFRAFEDNDDQGNALGRLLELLDTLWPRVQYPHGFRADQIAERMIDHGLGLDAEAVELRGLFDTIGPRPLAAVTGLTIGNRLRLMIDNPSVVEGAVMILRKRANPGGSHLPASYQIVRKARP